MTLHLHSSALGGAFFESVIPFHAIHEVDLSCVMLSTGVLVIKDIKIDTHTNQVYFSSYFASHRFHLLPSDPGTSSR